MKELPRISEAEWKVMKVVWERSPILAQEIVDEIAERENWHHKTVKTLLNRLVKKGALKFDKQGKAYRYRPNVSERECIRAESESFLQRIFGGALKPMLAQFVEERKLSEKEVRELRELLKSKK